jgi:Uma2 family endonuclease
VSKFILKLYPSVFGNFILLKKKKINFDKKLLMSDLREDFAPSTTNSDYETERGKPMPDKNHSIIQGRLMSKLDQTYGDRYSILPEITLDLPIRERVPDLAIYSPLDFNPDDNEVRMDELPLCAIEIISEMQPISVLMKKRSEYFLAGIKSYWLVMPSMRSIYVFENLEDFEIYTYKDCLIDKTLNIELDLGKIFR